MQEVDARMMLSQAETLADLVEQGGGPDLIPYLGSLRQGLHESVTEAHNFAAQQRADVERTKRTSDQVSCLPGPPIVRISSALYICASSGK